MLNNHVGAGRTLYRSMYLFLSLLICLVAMFAGPSVALADGLLAGVAQDDAAGVNMWRLYNPNSGEHFYTADESEMRHLASLGWQLEGVGWVAPLEGDPVFRLYNPNAGDHHYTASEGERDLLVDAGWTYEGVGWFSGGSATVLRQYNPNASTGSHNFTTSAVEDVQLQLAGWSAEGTAWFALSANPLSVTPSWLEGPAGERAYITADGSCATGRFEVGGQAFWGRPGVGWVVRGVWLSPDGTVVRAGSNGALREGSLTGTAELDVAVDDFIRAHTGTGDDALRRLYDTMRTYPYLTQDHVGTDWESWSVGLALDFYHNGMRGNCYRFAAFEYWVARGLGYDEAVIVRGKVRITQGFAEHAWMQIPVGGVPCVFDPEMVHINALRDVSFFLVPYPQTRVEYFDYYGNSLG